MTQRESPGVQGAFLVAGLTKNLKFRPFGRCEWFFFYVRTAGSCPPSPHPHGDPAIHFTLSTEDLLSSLHHIHLTLQNGMWNFWQIARQLSPTQCVDVLSLSLCHIVVVVIMFTCEHVSHRSGGESNPDRSDESTEYNPLHCASTIPVVLVE